MNVLMMDVGGTNVKVMASYDDELRKFPSGEKLTAKGMVRGVLRSRRGSSSIAFPRLSGASPEWLACFANRITWAMVGLDLTILKPLASRFGV